ncbi:hypothetical protein AAEO57_04845 [Flavobacterium sp. DGU38]|uniref:Uncharacterized protein n=2 Tax=Flavobacterium calami TaxID=3139144 RepID=A0ABU9ILP6_9FLAO
MRSFMAKPSNSNSIKHFDIQSNTNLIDAEFYSEQQTLNPLVDLYLKNHDEPDFDCEFLCGISHYYNENENTIDPETDEDPADLYNDNQWDADIYDPYVESSYF